MPGSASSLQELPAYLLASVHDFLDSACILAITDTRGQIVFVNDAFVAISGYEREELIGRNHRILKSGRHTPEFYRDMWQAIARGRTWRGEICNRAKDGRLYWVDSTLTPIRDHAGRIAYYCALRVDITEKKALQEELLRRADEEARIERTLALGRMADAVCHDMNNLLSGAMLMTDLLPSASAPEAQPLRAVLTRMAEMVRNLRDFSTGRLTEARSFNLASLVADTCKLAGFEAVRSEKAQLTLDLDELATCEVLANESQILEIVLNLVTNAIEAMRLQSDAHIAVRGSFTPQGHACIEFQDNGPGVAPEIRDRIFESYESTKGAGRGLGLSAARALARTHKGELELVESARGACFRLTLPVLRRIAHAVAAVEHDRVLLLMEDESDIVHGIEEAAGRRGLRVLQGHTSEEMLLWVSKFTGSLAGAVLDSAGTSDDHALVGALRTFRADLPIVLISASLHERGVRQTRHGPVVCLPKPFRLEDLMRAVAGDLAQGGGI
ncbi:MAG: PAS domain S-box protein [Opitutaceae bacterium]|nr:PAS domain S-box protein [Opitutaceae bacterium]